jgi:hypothetical protein
MGNRSSPVRGSVRALQSRKPWSAAFWPNARDAHFNRCGAAADLLRVQACSPVRCCPLIDAHCGVGRWTAARHKRPAAACTEWLAMQKIYCLPSSTRDHTVPIVLSYVRIGRLLTTCACATARRCIFPLSALLRHRCCPARRLHHGTTPIVQSCAIFASIYAAQENAATMLEKMC